MKKLFLIMFLLLALVITAASCSEKPSSGEPTDTTVEAPDTIGSVTGEGFQTTVPAETTGAVETTVPTEETETHSADV